MFPHNGLAMLATILKKAGHEVMVVDYAFLVDYQYLDISFFIKTFNPDIIGFSIYTTNANEAQELILKTHNINPKIPIMVGGPHATLYSSVLKKDKKIDYIFIGESELTILGAVENAKKEKAPKIIQTKELVDVNDLPFPDNRLFYKYETMTHYPIMTSRGCPNQCIFCASFGLSRRWRARRVEDCIKELEIAKKEVSPHLKFVVFDDNPTVLKKRFNEFLDLYYKRIKSELTIVNTRADGIDEEFLILLKKCKVPLISIGVEHAHPEVYKLINKGETLEQIEKACKLVKKHKIKLAVSFVIGLPGDSIERTKASIRFCKRVKADVFSINQMCPFKGTKAREMLESINAKIYDEVGYDAQHMVTFECEEPIVETPNFTKKERRKAYYMFLFGVADRRLQLKKIFKIWTIARKYGLYSEFFCWLPYGILRSLKEKQRYLSAAINIYKTDGLKHLIKRFNALRKQQKIYKTYRALEK
jgi:anaerobic magnesium-protoporphyrin IX monomethyl ester cyclase